jgi:hypothetical protein
MNPIDPVPRVVALSGELYDGLAEWVVRQNRPGHDLAVRGLDGHIGGVGLEPATGRHADDDRSLRLFLQIAHDVNRPAEAITFEPRGRLFRQFLNHRSFWLSANRTHAENKHSGQKTGANNPNEPE